MLSIKRLTKSYGKFLALDGLNLEIGAGELFGFIGPNGAGKTTTMKIIVGLLHPDSGEIYLEGQNIYQAGYRKLSEKIGYMPDFFGVYDNLTVLEYMDFYAAANGMTKQKALKKTDELLEIVNLIDRKTELVDGLSRGMKQRLCLARTMLHDPEFLILDEPSSGMEPRLKQELKEILCQLCCDGKTILVSSHNLKDLAEMCTNVGIIEKGKLIVQGNMEAITAEEKCKNPLSMHFTVGLEEGMRFLKGHPLVTNIARRESDVSVNFSGTTKDEAELLTALIKNGAGISLFKREEGTLEAVFFRMTQEERKEDEITS